METFDEKSVHRYHLPRGRMKRIAPGCYVDADEWAQAYPSDRFLTAATAVGRAHVLTSRSAAAVLGLPLVSIPQEIDIAVTGRGHVGRTPPGRFPFGMKRVRSLSQPIEFGNLLITPPSESILRAAGSLPFGEAVALCDAALRRHYVDDASWAPSGPDLMAALESAAWRGGRANARRVLELARPQSESPGESMSRVLIIESGFRAPELQVRFGLSSGETVRCDFFWREAGIIGEFDGLIKYQPGLSGQRSPAEVAMEERQRESALHDLGFRVLRWTWSALRGEQPLLPRLLGEAGVPRA